ncbi:MAG: PilZ domain-containing protein [Halobacteriovoraceae bacterium]|nr:PilZ domain-containing protein [Halobacteriovoraceae bacterium]
MTDDVLDFQKKREESIEKKRRNFERILFQSTLGAYSVVDDAGSIHPIQLVDISRDGCLFQVPWDPKQGGQKFQKDTEINIRMYFSKIEYIPVICLVKYSNEYVDESGQVYLRYGAEFDKTTTSFQAMESFIEFLYKFAEHSAIDKGDKKVFFI